MMTSRQLIRWSRLHEQRTRTLPSLTIPLLAAVLLTTWVWLRLPTSLLTASHAWLAGTLLAFALAFLRVPFHIYWRADAAMLAQLPIEGRPLFDAALLRCARAAAFTAIPPLLALLPLLTASPTSLVLRHATFTLTLALTAGLLVPAVTIGAAALVVAGGADRALRTATALGGAPASTATTPTTSPAAILGALPGLAGAIIIVAALLVTPWLVAGTGPEAPIILVALAAISIASAIAARSAASVMAQVLRDVSALDRQRLAHLEIKPPTAIESVIARLIGDAAHPYRKNALLMRRRFPIAYALGALVFLILIIVGWSQPDDPTPWLTVAIAGSAIYGVILAARLRRPPIDLPRLSATLPLTARSHARARLAWLLGWWVIFTGAPAVFAALRQTDPAMGLTLTAAATLLIIVAGALPR